MFSKSEEKALKQEFWTNFGKWSSLKRKRKGKKKWLLNKTGVKGYRFKFENENKTVCVCLEIIDDNDVIREIKYEKLLTLKSIFDESFNGKLIWDKEYYSSPGKPVVRVYISENGFTFKNRDHWPRIFKFFYENMDKFEEIFNDYKEYLKEEE